MARIRTLKPELASDMKLASVSRDARYTFVLLITQSDDEGLIPGSPRQLLGSLYPHEENVTPQDLTRWLAELRRIEVIRDRATVDGAPVLELVNWSKHQRVDNKGRSILAAHLAPLAESRGDSPRTAEDRGLDLGPRTMDPGEGPGSEDLGPPPPARDIDGFADRFAESRHRDAYVGHRKAAQNPKSLDYEVRLLAEGGERPGKGAQAAFGWEVVGEALHQLSLNGGPIRARALLTFCEGVVLGSSSGIGSTGNQPASALQERAAQVWRRYSAAGLVRDGMPRQEVERIGRKFVEDGLYPDYAGFLAEYIAVEPARLAGAQTDHWAVARIVERLTDVSLAAGSTRQVA